MDDSWQPAPVSQPVRVAFVGEQINEIEYANLSFPRGPGS